MHRPRRSATQRRRRLRLEGSPERMRQSVDVPRLHWARRHEAPCVCGEMMTIYNHVSHHLLIRVSYTVCHVTRDVTSHRSPVRNACTWPPLTSYPRARGGGGAQASGQSAAPAHGDVGERPQTHTCRLTALQRAISLPLWSSLSPVAGHYRTPTNARAWPPQSDTLQRRRTSTRAHSVPARQQHSATALPNPKGPSP